MSVVLLIIGLLIILVAMVDLIVTTLTMEGAGPVSNPVSHFMWRWFRPQGRSSGARRRIMSGPAVLVVMILFWVVCIWVGWVLVFSWQGITLVNAQSGLPSTLAERIYYTGYTITTVGYGDFKALDTRGQFASAIAGFNGLFLLTLAITYSIQVLTAVVENRRLALMIDAMEQIRFTVQQSAQCDKESVEFISGHLASLDMAVAGAAQKHLAYPVIQAFSERSARVCLPVNIQRLTTFLTRVLANRQAYPLKVIAQCQVSLTLVRALAVNAITSHWSSLIRDKRIRDALNEDMAMLRRGVHAQSFETVLAVYVESSGWGALDGVLPDASYD